jgi:hypothetical protein
MNRQALERHVLDDLFSRDARFAPRSRKWARLALDIKTLTLDGASPEMILEELEDRMARIELGPEDALDIEPEAEQVEGLEAALALTGSGAGHYADLNG